MVVALGGVLPAGCGSSSAPVPGPDPAVRPPIAVGSVEAAAASATAAAPGGAAPSEPSPAARALSGRTTLVWVRGRDKRATTYFYETGRPPVRRTGIFVAVGADLYRWDVTRTQSKSSPCPLKPNPYPDVVIERPHLSRVGTSAGKIDFPPPPPEPAAESEGGDTARDEYTLIATLGPALFARSDTIFWPCGLHPQVGASFHAASLEGGTVRPLPDADLFEGAAELLERATALLNEGASDEPESLDGPVRPAEVSTSLAQPTFASVGLAWSVMFTTRATWAGSSGGWSGYTRSVSVPLARAPARFRALAPLADRAREHLAAHPGQDVRGVSSGDVSAPP